VKKVTSVFHFMETVLSHDFQKRIYIICLMLLPPSEDFFLVDFVLP